MRKSREENKVVRVIGLICVIGIIIIGVWVFAMKLINISDDYAMVETQNEEYEEVRYF